MHGSENGRPAAKYAAERALFLMLLAAPYQAVSQASTMVRSPAATHASRRLPRHQMRG